MNQITKFLLRLSLLERNNIILILQKIYTLDLGNLDIKKLQ